MQAEHLHQIVGIVVADLEKMNLSGKLENLSRVLGSEISPGSEISTQKTNSEINQNAAEIFSTLENSDTYNFKPAWRSLISETMIERVLAHNLHAHFEFLIKDHAADINKLRTEIDKFKKEIETSKQSLKNFSQGFAAIGFSNKKLKFDECELCLNMPREAMECVLFSFAEDLKKMENDFLAFVQITGRESPGFKIKHISSSDASAIVAIDLDLGNMILDAMIALQQAVRKLEDKRKFLQLMADLPQKLQDEIKAWMENTINDEIEKIIVTFKGHLEILTEPDSERVNELKNNLRAALRDLLHRLETGYSFEVRTASPREIESTTDYVENLNIKTLNEKLRRIHELSKKLQASEDQSVSTSKFAQQPQAAIGAAA